MRAGLVLLVMTPLAVPPAADKPASVAASRITLKSGTITLLEAVKELQRQSGNAIEDWRPRRGQPVTNPVLSLDLERISFWEAVDVIARKADVAVYPFTGSPAVGILKGPATRLSPSYAGPFRIVLKRLAAVLDLQDGNRYLEGTLELAWEPRYRPLLLKPGGEPFRAFTENEELPPVPAAGRGDVRLAGLSAIDWPIRLPAPPRTVVTLKRVEGTIQVLVAPGTHRFRFEARADAQEQKHAGVAITLRRFRVERGQATAVIELKYPREALDLESHQVWAVQDTLQVEKDGKALGNLKDLGRDVNVKEGNVIEVTYRFSGVPADLKGVTLTYDAPAVPVLYPVKFSFQDVPLP